MALVLDPETLSEASLRALVASLREDLEGTLEMVREPRGRVLAAASLRTAEELVEAALVVLRTDRPKSRAELAAEANLAYAAMISAIDLVKSHSDVPQVPVHRAD